MNECKIVEDLLPLYAEELVSEETAEFVREHAASCPGCEKLIQRTKLLTPDPKPDPQEYKNALRRDSRKMVVKGLLTFLLVAGIFVGLVAGGSVYVLWENGEFPVEQVFVAPDGENSVTVGDWDTAGFFENGKGSVVKVVVRDRDEDGNYRGSSSIRSGVNWENLDGAWSPDSGSFLAAVDLVEGGKGIFLFTGTGEEDDPIGWEGRQYENGLVTVLTRLCQSHPDFPQNWQEITFTFHTWHDDSETIIFIYETDTGCRGFVDYHYPTETITAVD